MSLRDLQEFLKRCRKLSLVKAVSCNYEQDFAVFLLNTSNELAGFMFRDDIKIYLMAKLCILLANISSAPPATSASTSFIPKCLLGLTWGERELSHPIIYVPKRWH